MIIVAKVDEVGIWAYEEEASLIASILLVDDTALNLELLETLCRYAGHTTRRADNVVAALTLSRADTPDLIVSDVHMTPLDGYDLLRAVKDDPQLKRIPFILVSMSGGHMHDSVKAKALGACKFIGTPLEPQVMLAEIQDCLGISQASNPTGDA
jgi:CheY-like chemotaxis protein